MNERTNEQMNERTNEEANEHISTKPIKFKEISLCSGGFFADCSTLSKSQ